jgi:hypothetical protein
MTTSTSTNLSGKSFLCFGLILIAIGISRYIPIDHPGLFNFSPTLAIFLIAGAYLKGKYAFIFPISGIIITDLTLNPNYGVNLLEPFMVITIGSYFLIFFFGKKVGNQSSMPRVLGAGIASAIFFHLTTCTFAWMVNPAYMKSLYGWIQSILLGEPGYAPSYLFLRNSVLSTALFSVLFAMLQSIFQANKNQRKCRSETRKSWRLTSSGAAFLLRISRHPLPPIHSGTPLCHPSDLN